MKFKTIAVIFFGIILLYGVTAKVSESNWACGACHSSQHERWAVSSHQSIDCRQCHIDPGVSGAVDAQINGIGNLFTAVIHGTDIQPHKDPIPVSTENCMGCHAGILHFTEMGYEDLPDNSLKGQGLIIAHRTHVEKYNMNCVDCHRGIVHRDPDEIAKYPLNWPFMHIDCGPCHRGAFMERFQVVVTDLEDRSKCTTCHPYYEPPPDYEEEIIKE